MKVLVVTARAPALHGKGDQVRVAQLLPSLCTAHEVTVLYPIERRSTGSGVPARDEPEGWSAIPVQLSAFERMNGALASWLKGHPAQAGWCAPRRFRAAVGRAADSYDLLVFITTRCFVELPGRPFVIDHVDALSLNARRRGKAAQGFLARTFWRRESRRLARWEDVIARRAGAQLVTSAADAAALPTSPDPVVVPIGVDADALDAPLSSGPRDIDVIFTGNMRYPANRDAACWLINAIAPVVRAGYPDLRIVIAGRAANSLPRADGIEIASDVPSLMPFLQRAKIAVAPLRIGTGVPIKVLEAASAGAAVVMTPEANAGLGFNDRSVVVAQTSTAFAAEIVRLLHSPERRQKLVESSRQELRGFDLRRVAKTYLAALDRGVSSRSYSTQVSTPDQANRT
ncbi:glycosyltransferase family 4 protein [Actinopolymorpha alba]|uniref:glycosyltransferase family 4 protein n=1 Tax=Actinopolymorpha alba TaxID=533267 RepID=UPI0012F655DC|nr:glycosyltransferase family 4 protein [Actinopolymorpha alba]